jgi:hypothetical protein
MARIVQISATGPGQWTRYALNQRKRAIYVYGQEFLRAALKTGSPLVRAFLLGQALELLLKAYLLNSGLTSTRLMRRPFGHNIARLLAEANDHGLGSVARVSAQTAKDITVFSEAYAGKVFQYFSILHLLAPPKVPQLNRVLRFTRTLEERLGKLLAAA